MQIERCLDCGSAEGAVHRELVTTGAPLLRSHSADASDPRETGALCEKLIALLREIQGAGLAAPQVGVPLNVFVVEVRKTELNPDRPESPLYVMVNPQLLEQSEEEREGWEGCFSVPGYMGLVPRSTRLTLRYWTPDGEEHKDEFTDYVARVIQHEYDHLRGKIYLDRMRSMQSFCTKANYLHFELYKSHASG